MVFLDIFSDRYFETTIENVQRAEYMLNKKLSLRGVVSLNQFYRFLNVVAPLDYGDNVGWSLNAGDLVYGYSCIDFRHEQLHYPDGTTVCSISMPYEPTRDYLDYQDLYPRE